MGNVTGSMQKIRDLCCSLHLEQNKVWAKAGLLIKVYPEIVWANNHSKTSEGARLPKTCEKKFEIAIRYIADFEPMEGKRRFHEKIIMLFEIKWLTELISSAMKHIEDFPVNGIAYYKILANLFSIEPCSDRICQKEVGLEKTAFYERKREAILLLGIELWGIVIPSYLDRN